MREVGVWLTIPQLLTLQEMQNHKFRAWLAEFEPVPSAGEVRTGDPEGGVSLPWVKASLLLMIFNRQYYLMV